MLLLAQVESNVRFVALLMVLANTVWGFSGGSDFAIPVDLAAEFAGAVTAFMSTFANLATVLTPVAVGWFLDGKVGNNPGIQLNICCFRWKWHLDHPSDRRSLGH